MGLVAHRPRVAWRLLRGPVVDYARALRRIDMDSVKREEQQSYWDEVAASFGAEGQYDLWRRHSDRVNHDLLEAWLPGAPVARLLKTDLFDEAMSEGLYPLLARQAKRVDGVDISIQAVAAASARYPELQARYADLRQLPYTDGAFDCVVSNSTLDHFEDRGDIATAVAELYRVVRPGGQLLVTLDNLQNPVVWLRNHLPQKILNRTGIVPYFVGRTLARRGLVRILRETGFEVLETTAIMHCPRTLAVARAAAVQKRSDAERQARFLERLQRWERLRNWPSRYFTGYFVAARARRPG